MRLSNIKKKEILCTKQQYYYHRLLRRTLQGSVILLAITVQLIFFHFNEFTIQMVEISVSG